MSYSKYNLVTYDVWGNEEDGWDVNDIYQTSTYIDLPDDDDVGTLGPDELFVRLNNAGILAGRVGDWAFDFSQEDMIGIATDDGQPVAELRKVEVAS